jgi:hypothetical protein
MEYLSGEILIDEISPSDNDQQLMSSLAEDDLDVKLNLDAKQTLLEKIISRYHPSRRLGKSFFNDHVLVSRSSMPSIVEMPIRNLYKTLAHRTKYY